MKVISQLVQDLERYKVRELSDISHIMIHRSAPWPTSYGVPNTAKDLVEIFYSEDLGTGRKMPYTFVYNPRSITMYQALPVNHITPHARVHSRSSLAIAILQDLRDTPLSPDAYRNLVSFCARLRQYLLPYGTPTLVGHTELAGATGDPTKQCPGSYLDTALLDRHTQEIIEMTQCVVQWQ